MARGKRNLWSWLTDKNKRTRLIIWLGVIVMLGVGFVAIALGVTSSYWFCANTCHKVQDDTIIAYNRAPHSKISCMACHMPVNADPVTFLIHKAAALGELYATITNNFELPLNPESLVAEEMKPELCTQCHSVNRRWTFSPGIIMNHEKHAAEGISCTICHNRTAHIEDFKLVGVNPNGEPSRKHETWMTMEACWRCHNLNPNVKGMEGLNAPGKCETCHPADFELKPNNHFTRDFDTSGHPKMFEVKGGTYCYMCHDKISFCNKCHGVEMPHPADWKNQHKTTVTALGPAGMASCRRCHPGDNFCNDCHHGTAIGITYNPKVPWVRAHPSVVKAKGGKVCDPCHQETFCSGCHVNLAKRGLLVP